MVLMMTAEVWELGMNQSLLAMVTLSTLSLAGASAFVIVRQKLLLLQGLRGLTERIAAANIAVLLVVALGMLSVYGALFALSLLLGYWLYPTALVAAWTPSVAATPAIDHYLLLSALVSSLGLIIGALGASLEEQGYFRHVICVDEEL